MSFQEEARKILEQMKDNVLGIRHDIDLPESMQIVEVHEHCEAIIDTALTSIINLVDKEKNLAVIEELEGLLKEFHYDNPRQKTFRSALDYRLTRLKCDCPCHSPAHYAPHKSGHFCCSQAITAA